MKKSSSLNARFEESLKKHWDRPALSDYHGKTLTYGEVAEMIAKIHIFFESCGIQKGDKIALCSKNQANWTVAYLAILTYGAVVVPLLHEFKPGAIHHLVNHSDAKLLFIGNVIWENLNAAEMPELEAIITLTEFDVAYARKPEYNEFRPKADEIFKSRYPDFGPKDLNYHEDKPDELALISYTSGSTGFSKGVMLPYRSMLYNLDFAYYAEPQMNCESKVVSMLPTAHMFGMQFEFIYEFCIGAHIFFLTRLPSPKVILEAMKEIKPQLVVSVPLILEKIYKNMLVPFISKNYIKMFLSLPMIDQIILNTIRQRLMEAFGGQFEEVIVGGAPLNREVEAFLRRIKFPLTVGYGMTECGPIISYTHWNKCRLYACGKAAPKIDIKIDSPDPENVPGEILVKGDNVFLGYYKNPEATKAVMDHKWLRTGDMGVIDKDGYLFLRGRSKSMILGPSGQNIYPEEIESSINNLAYVGESLVVEGEDAGSLTALIYPDFDAIENDGLPADDKSLTKMFMDEMKVTNLELPTYCKVTEVQIFPEEFEKTPKRSIKRYLYHRR